MKYWFISLIFCWASMIVRGQSPSKHHVFFENGKASISLEQLDSIKNWTSQAKQLPKAKISVYAYANSATTSIANASLAANRALLLQQCMEREGIAIQSLYVAAEGLTPVPPKTCQNCVVLKVSTDSVFLYKNIYQEQIKKYLKMASRIVPQSFWISPRVDTVIVTAEGLVLHIPKGAFDSENNLPVLFEISLLPYKSEMLLHSFTTRNKEKSPLDLEQIIHLTASQNGNLLGLAAHKYITVIAPTYLPAEQVKCYEFKDKNWIENKKATFKVGAFSTGKVVDCQENNNDTLGLPSFETPPSKPKLIDLNLATAKQNEIIEYCDFRLDFIESKKINAKGKAQKLTKELQQNAYTFKAKKDRALIAKEKIKNSLRKENEAAEEAYYKNLAIYTKKRNKQQMAYIEKLNKAGQQQQNLSQKCGQYQEDLAYLKRNFSATTFQAIQNQLLRINPQRKSDCWLKINELGWLALASPAKMKKDLIPFRVLSNLSAYNVTAFLVYDNNQQILLGEAVSETEIIFSDIPNNSSAKVLAIVKEGEEFLVAWQPVRTDGKTIELDFKLQDITTILSYLNGAN